MAFLSIAAENWVLGFFAALFLLVTSYLAIYWKTCKAYAKRYMHNKNGYDYKSIFKHYLSHVNSIQDKRSLYRTILQVVCEAISASSASLLLNDNGEFTIKESVGSKPISFQVGNVKGFLDWLTVYGHPVSRYQLVNRKEFAKAKGDGLQFCVQFHAECSVPLFVSGRLIGVINIGTRTTGELFDGATRELLDILGGQVAVAIHNASLYEDMVRRNVKLQEVSRLRSQLLSNVSHEFRTPLNSIIGLSDVMADGSDGPITAEQREHLQMISSSSKRLLETVSAMVDLAKLEANHLSLNVKRVNISKLVSKVAEGITPNKDTSLKLSISQESPQIYGDEDWLNKLFAHVLSNAVKYTPSGEIIIDAERSGEMLKIGVHDTGIGIDDEKKEKIFESFTQASEGATRNYEGAGVGLAISKKVVELHGGRIWLTSTPGKGSHFFFTLPLKPTSLKSVELK